MGVLGPISERRRVSAGLLGFVVAALMLAATGCGTGTDSAGAGAGLPRRQPVSRQPSDAPRSRRRP